VLGDIGRPFVVVVTVSRHLRTSVAILANRAGGILVPPRFRQRGPASERIDSKQFPSGFVYDNNLYHTLLGLRGTRSTRSWGRKFRSSNRYMIDFCDICFYQAETLVACFLYTERVLHCPIPYFPPRRGASYRLASEAASGRLPLADRPPSPAISVKPESPVTP
jgi:hypothetical protein